MCREYRIHSFYFCMIEARVTAQAGNHQLFANYCVSGLGIFFEKENMAFSTKFWSTDSKSMVNKPQTPSCIYSELFKPYSIQVIDSISFLLLLTFTRFFFTRHVHKSRIYFPSSFDPISPDQGYRFSKCSRCSLGGQVLELT